MGPMSICLPTSKPNAEAEEEAFDRGQGADNFNAAWEVLGLSRAIYEKQMDRNEVRIIVKRPTHPC